PISGSANAGQPLRGRSRFLQAMVRARQFRAGPKTSDRARAARRAASEYARSGEYWVYLTDEQARWR
ncbi:MAG: hypothetical protein MJE77_48210, partial [Proteobacteria bacterium]|nr:hypothetical protein [Pseudomonadota bacterium]